MLLVNRCTVSQREWKLRTQKAMLKGIQENKEFDTIRHMKQQNDIISKSHTIARKRCQYLAQ